MEQKARQAAKIVFSPIFSAMTDHATRFHLFLAAILCGVLAWSGWQPFDRATWWMEVAPVLVALPILVASYTRYRLTNMLYVLIVLHAIVLMVGGAYSYARVPLGFDIQHWLGMTRNPYDKIGHFVQGFVPAMVAREILLRGRYVVGRKMLAFIVISIVLAISASYELIEWGAAMAMGQGADEFLGTQGDPWDTQSDMLMALIGGSCALLLLTRWHDRLLQRLPRG
jgi:putative membrane protein